MKTRYPWQWGLACLAFLVSSVAFGEDIPQPYLSPLVLAPVPETHRLLVACETAQKLLQVGLTDFKVEKAIDLPERPSGIAVRSDGKRVYVTAGGARGLVLELDGDTLTTLRSMRVGHTPIAPQLGVDGKTLFVCNRFQDEVAVIDVETFTVKTRIPVSREPVAADLTPDGRTLFVANHLPDGRADADYIASKISVIDTASRTLVKTIPLVNGAEGMRDIRVSPDGKQVYATHLVARYHVPTSQLTRGWMNTNAVSAIRVADQKLLYTVLLDDVDLGFANPWSVAVSADAKRLAVSGAGTDEISLIDLPGLTRKIQEKVAARNPNAESEAAPEAYNDLSFLHDIRIRLRLKGKGPRGICFVGSDLYVAEYFSDSLGRVPMAADSTQEVDPRQIESHPLGPEVPVTLARRGEVLFNDANLCFQTWQSCASCHPDARTDALNWDLLNDGIGNPKNVKSMLLAHVTPPAMALGVRPDAEAAVRAGIRHIQFAVRSEEDAVAIDSYLKSLKPVPSPYLIDGQLSESALRGKKLFARMRCNRCHPSPLFTDMKQHVSDIAKGLDVDQSFDTPTLVELWRTAPYLHDGRAVTVDELLDYHPQAESTNSDTELSERERSDLVHYLLSL